MEKFKKHLFTVLAGIISGVFIAMGVHNCNRQPIETKVERDTVIVTDTTVHYYPKPVEVTKTKTEYRWLTRVEHSTDTLTRTDSVLVEVPIESRHYHGEEYDAWVSGYEPSLDSIFIRQRTEYITERITQMKPPNRWELDLVGGIDYRFTDKKYTPHVGGELLYKPNRLQVGVRGGIQYDNTVQPFVGGVVKLRLL
jgi:hypothetical protein